MNTDIIKLYKEGFTVTEIAKKLHIKAPYIYTVLKDYLHQEVNDEIKGN